MAISLQSNAVAPADELDGAITASSLVVFAGLFTALGNVGFQTLIARANEVASYGVASGLFSVAGAAVFLAAGLQYSVGRLASLSSTNSRTLLRHAIPGLYPWVGLGVLVAMASPAIADYLRLSSALPILLTLLYSLLMVAAGIPAGLLIGRRRFRAYALAVCISVLVRILVGLALAMIWPGVDSAMVASVIGASSFIIALVASTTRAEPFPGLVDAVGPQRAPFSDAVPSAILAGLLWFQWTFPLIAARHVLAPGQVGDFGAANLFASGIIVLAGPLTTALFPALVRSRRQRVFIVGLGATIALSLTLALALVLLGPFAIRLVYGGRYHISASVLGLLSLSAIATTIWTYLLWVLRARGNSLRGVSLVAVVAIAFESIVSAFPFRHSEISLAVLPAVALLVGSTANVLRHAYRLKKSVPPPQPMLVRVHANDDEREQPDAARSGSLLASVAVGMMVYNEEHTLEVCMRAVLDERDGDSGISRLIVVASGCTDGSETIVRDLASKDDRVVLISQSVRQGKVAAVNQFLAHANEPICALVNADTLLAPGSLTRLVEPLRNSSIGMVGGRVVPLNGGQSLPVKMVRLLWNLHHEIAMDAPKLGEAVVFRNCFDQIEAVHAADEVSLEFQVMASGQRLHYAPDAVIYNYGAASVRDFYRHRKRNHELHLDSKNRNRYKPSTMRWSSAVKALVHTLVDQPEEMLTVCALVGVEIASRANANLSRRLGESTANTPFARIGSAKRPFTRGIHTLDGDGEGDLDEVTLSGVARSELGSIATK